MSEQEMTAFNELINGFEIVGSLTPEGTAFIKRGVQHLQQEIQQLKEKLAILKCSKEYKEIVETNGIVQQRDLYKEIIEEVREYIEHKGSYIDSYDGQRVFYLGEVEQIELLQIVDKAKESEE